ncbi:MAG: hypothetical protein LBU61_05685 [Coriobacteriales bacterium]|jgi:hypothetical protein|nr:hypothetical protein [Coriobacteriales bacterium]
MKRVLAAAIVTMIGLIALFAINIMSNNQEPSYETVLVTVVETSSPAGDNKSASEVIVTYNGKQYQLQSTTTANTPAPGTEFEAYLSQGEMYASIDDLITPLPITGLYRFVLTITIASGMSTLIFWTLYRKGSNANV